MGEVGSCRKWNWSNRRNRSKGKGYEESLELHECQVYKTYKPVKRKLRSTT